MEVSEVKRLKSFDEENARLKKLPVEATLDNEPLQVALGAKVLTAGQKREAVESASFSQRRLCRLAGVSLSTFRD